MANQPFDFDTLSDFVERANAVGYLARDEKAFYAAFDAIRDGDAKEVQAILQRVGLFPSCELICEWVRVKDCGFLCLELCGPPKPINQAPNPRLLADAIVRLTSNETSVRALVDVVETRDRDAFQRLVEEYNIATLCHLLCYWLCAVRYRLICRWVCDPDLVERPDFVVELQSAGQALRRLLEHEDSFARVAAASNAGDPATMRSVIGGADLIPYCSFICEWFCSWRCALVCLTLCRESVFELATDPLVEALAFAKVTAKLALESANIERLVSAVRAGDAKAWGASLKDLELEPYCIQLCHWVCALLCRRYCVLVCPPIFEQPWFTHVGDFSITADIDPSTGLTNKAENSHGGPDYGFFNCLSLQGFCPKADPTDPTEQMAYRFLYQAAGAAAPTPVTGGFVCEVLVGTRYTLWNGNPNTLQSVRIIGTGTTSPTPPVGPPGPNPPDHYIVPDANGWIPVDANALDDGFDGWLMGFASEIAFPGGDPAPGVSAGKAVPVAAQKNGSNAAIIFQATRLSTIASVNIGGAPDYTNQLSLIHINNWNEVSLINLEEFAGGMSCTPVTTSLHIQYTTDHELMAQWSIDMVTAATVTPAPTFPDGFGPRGSSGVDLHDTTSWPQCSYLLRLHTRRSLTDGLLDDPDKWEGSFLTFCID